MSPADPPPPPQKRYLTRVGAERFRKELLHLWNVERRKVVNEVTVAAALGDRSENADYIYGKRRLREIDRRVQYLTKLMDEAVIVDATEKLGSKKIFFGATVTLEDEDGHEQTWQLVGVDEVDAAKGRISLVSPLGKALLGRSLGDSFEFKRPKGDVEFTITAVTYVSGLPDSSDHA